MDASRLQAKMLEFVKGEMQDYLDQTPVESDQFLTGLDVTLPVATELFNDFLLWLNDGQEVADKLS